jgi:hypothetical protein
MIATKRPETRTTAKLRVEELESRVVLTTYNVGPAHTYAALHDVPWDKVGPGDTVKVFWQATPYLDKIVLNNSGTSSAPITIIGINGPNGQKPIISALGAIENPQAKFWSNQVSKQGIFTLAPVGYSVEVQWITISNFELKDALRESWFINSKGETKYYNYHASAVALYHAKNIVIHNCIIHNNENGIFGKSEGWANGDLRNIKVRGNTFYGNGRAYEDHYHNSYIEGIHTVYEYNTFLKPKDGSAGCNIKDRGAGTVVRYNWLEGGLRILDLVDPEDGAPSFLQDPLWGSTFVYGNIIVNPKNGGATSLIHFGFDGLWYNAQVNLYFYQNTVVNINDLTAGGRWYTYLFKMNNDNSTVYASQNIFHSFAPVEGHWSGDFYMMSGGGRLKLLINWVPVWTKMGNVYELVGEANLIKGEDPGFVSQLHRDFRLKKSSDCRVGPQPPNAQYMPKFVYYEYDYDTGTWVLKTMWMALGAIG